MTKHHQALIASVLTSSPAVLAQPPAVPTDFNPVAVVQAMEGALGVHPGFRPTHARGVCASGHFVGTEAGRGLSSASAFNGSRIPVVARFSVGGNAVASEKAKSARGLALQFSLPNGEQWLMANITAPVFFVSTPSKVGPFFAARARDPETGKPDPAKVAAFNAANPDTQPQIDYLAKDGVAASYAAISYFGVHAFRFINADNEATFAKWSFVPEAGQARLDEAALAALPDPFLADELAERLKQGPVAFGFQLQLAGSGDSLDDPTVIWPENREQVVAGHLVIEKLAQSDACDSINFNPNVLPKGVSAGLDPMLPARAAPYAISQAKRLRGK